jgi:ribonuclease HI
MDLLLFDGGSRGNPGPGGSGAVILRVTAHAAAATIIWIQSVHHADPATTNNQAEYSGLLAGLQAAATRTWKPLTVVGDS